MRRGRSAGCTNSGGGRTQAAEVNRQFFCRLVTIVRFLLETFQNHVFKAGGEIVAARRGAGRLLIDDVVRKRGGEPFLEWTRTRGHFEEDGADRVNVAADVRGFPQQLFRRHVGERAGNSGHVGIAQREVACIVGLEQDGQAKIQDLNLVLRSDENVAGLQVAVDDAVLVGFLERRSDLEPERGDFFFRETFAAQLLRKRGAGDELHDQEVDTFLRIEVVDCGDVRVVQFREGEGFFPKTFAGGFVSEDSGRQNFQRDVAVKPFVMGAIDDAHPPGADFFEDKVAADGLADHLWTGLWGHLWTGLRRSY